MSNDKEERLKDEAKEKIDESIDEIHELTENLESVANDLAQLKMEGPEVQNETDLTRAFKEELDDVNDDLLDVSQDTMDVMTRLFRLRQGKTPYFAPGNPEQDAAMSAIASGKNMSRFWNRNIYWPLNELEDWDEKEPNAEHNHGGPAPPEPIVEVRGTEAWYTSNAQGVVYYLVKNMEGFDPL